MSLDPYDTQGLIGDLWDHTPSVPGYEYHDFPRASTLANLGGRGFPEVCSERFYLGVVLPDGSSGQGGNNDLWLGLEKAGSRCVEEGLLDEVAADIASGRRSEQIGGLTVYRDEEITTGLIGDVLITLFTTNPQTLIDMAPFVEQFFAGQPR